MLLLLALVVGCYSPEGRAYHDCVERMTVGCECRAGILSGAYEGNCGDMTEEEIEYRCSNLDETVCDPKRSNFDADKCERLHDDLSAVDDEWREEQRCAIRAVKNHCDELQAAEGAAEELEHEIAESCGWFD